MEEMHMLFHSDSVQSITRLVVSVMLILLLVMRTTPSQNVQADTYTSNSKVIWSFDPSFSGDGFADFPSEVLNNNVFLQTFLRSDGKLIVNMRLYDSFMGKYFPKSNVYTIFDTDGSIILTKTLGVSGWALGLQSNNKLLAIADSVLRRYNTDLTIDNTFFTSTWTILDPVLNAPPALLIQADDKVLSAETVISQSLNMSTSSLHLSRLNADGSLDTTYTPTVIENAPFQDAILGFDPTGRLIVSDTSCLARVYALDGHQIGTLGQSTCGGPFFHSKYVPYSSGGFVWFEISTTPNQHGQFRRSLSDQSLDNSFGVSGTVTVTAPAGYDFCCEYAIAAQTDGKIVLAAPIFNTSNPGFLTDLHLLIVRLTANGTVDPEFGGDGYLNLTTAQGSQKPELFITSDQKIVITDIYHRLMFSNMFAYSILRLAPFTVQSKVYLPTVVR